MRLTQTTKLTLLLDVVVAAVLLPALLGATYPLIFSYQLHKFLHIIGAILFTGNMIVGPVWLVYTIWSGDIRLIRFALRLIGITDVLISIPGILLLVFNGLCMASAFGGIYAATWIRDSIMLLGLMMILAVTIVLYYQEKLYHLAQQEERLTAPLRRTFWCWAIGGSIVGLLPGVVLYLMVTKQTLW